MTPQELKAVRARLETFAAGVFSCFARVDQRRWGERYVRVEHDYRELKTGLGLDHFEGRTWRGQHHHVTSASVAHAFCTLERLNPKAPAAV
jgi:SRSO17 transposase